MQAAQTITPAVVPPEPPPFRVRLDDGNVRINYHAGQIRALYSQSRFVGVIAGAQGGKTSFAPHWLLREIHLRGAGDYMFVAPSFKLLELKALKEFRIVFEQMYNLGTYRASPIRRFVFSYKGMEYIHGIGNFDPLNPTTVYFGHGDDPDSVESATIKGAVLDECGQRRFRQQTFEAMMRRGALYQARYLLTTTPYDLNWLYSQIYLRYRDEVQAGKLKSAERTFDIINFPSVANPAFPLEEDVHARRMLPRWKYLMFYRGKFVKPAGLIYDVFDDRLAPLGKVVPRAAVPHTWLKTLALDFGAPNFAGVIIATNPLDWRHEVIEEYFPHETRTADEHYKALTLDGARAFKYVVGGALSEGQWRAELYASGFKNIEPSPVRLVEVGIDRVYGAFKDDRLYVQEHCKRLRNDLTGYSRELDEAGEPTLKIADKNKYHHADALRYGVSKLEGHELSEWSAEDMQALDPDAGFAEPVTEDDADEYGGTRVVKRRKLGKPRPDDDEY